MIQPDATYTHKWRKGDIVIWDNRCSYHKAAGDYPRKKIASTGACPSRNAPLLPCALDRGDQSSGITVRK
jgi:alpha-ketoglutarate-dependent taurine dioxygenase